MNVLIVSHCDFNGNSAIHVLSIASELERRGFSPAVCVPANPETVADLGRPGFTVLGYETARHAGVGFPDGRGPDLVHAFTPRDHVRGLTEHVAHRYRCPYVVHLEDNEEVLVTDEFGGVTYQELRDLPQAMLDAVVSPWRAHPVRARRFLDRAAGMTAVIEKLLDFRPDGLPAAVFWPGFDPALVETGHDPAALRGALGLRESDLVLAYTGNIHASNLEEVRSLYVALALLRRAGFPAKLLKTGWNHGDMSWVADLALGDAVIDLGFVPRRRVGELLAIANVLVQPGGPSPFNDYRFPSKIPDFLASGKPVVLPRTNIGLHLREGEDALLLDRGHAGEIYEQVVRLAHNPDLARRLGRNGRAFALEHLAWEKSVDRIVDLYSTLEREPARIAGRAADRELQPVAEPPVKLLAFYLPQFHPIPENDEWWGTGFTEWTNVRKAEPLFRGHHQPQIPTELGFYDLREPEVMDEQARLAREHGIQGFCFYYYWFSGRRVLERPLDQMIDRGSPRFPFCLCWANENWTRRWDGLDNEVLLRQEYHDDWAERLFRDVLPTLLDPRHIRVRGAPLFLVYRANLVPDIARVTERWRELARDEAGVELHLAAVQSFGITDPTPYGFDAAVEFPPHTEHLPASRRAIRKLDPTFDGFLEDYGVVMRQQLAKELPPYPWYRGVMPSWDNTARRGHQAHILVNSSPDDSRVWLRKLVLQTIVRANAQEPLIFINAWNEWAEGTHLEPDGRHGRQWLEATRSALSDGVRQFYASRGLQLSETQALTYLRATLPPL